MSRHELEELLWLEMDGELSPRERERLDRHLAASPEATRLKAELEEFSAMLGRVETVESPDSLQPALHEALKDRKLPAMGRLLNFAPTFRKLIGTQYDTRRQGTGSTTPKGGDVMSKLPFIAALLAALFGGGVLGYFAGQGSSVDRDSVGSEKVVGTIGTADRYRTETVGDEDVQFAGEEGTDLGSATSPDDPFMAAVSDAFGRMSDAERAHFESRGINMRSGSLEARLAEMARAPQEMRGRFLGRVLSDRRVNALARMPEAARADLARGLTDAERAQALARASEAERAVAFERAPLERQVELFRLAPDAERGEILARAGLERSTDLARLGAEQQRAALERVSLSERSAMVARATDAERASLFRGMPLGVRFEALSRAPAELQRGILDRASLAVKSDMFARSILGAREAALARSVELERATELARSLAN